MKYKRFYINFLFLFFYSNFISLAQSPSNIYDKLEVAGNIKGDTLKAKSLRVTSNPLTGKVLTSDAQGNATWQTLPDLSPWSIAGSTLYPNPGRHVEPFGNNLYDLGSPSFRWRNIYLNNSPAVTSDRRIKKNIIPISYGLQSILALNPVQYNLIDSSDSTLKLGLIAQDVKLIIPEIVDIEKRNSIYSDDSRSSTYSLIHDMQSIRYSDLIPVLIKAIQELEEKVKILEVKIKN